MIVWGFEFEFGVGSWSSFGLVCFWNLWNCSGSCSFLSRVAKNGDSGNKGAARICVRGN